jgi:glycolate oxidase
MKHRYGQVTCEIIKELTAIVGKKNVYTAKDEMEKYSYDETPHSKRYFPEVVVKPSDIGSVAKLLFLANERRIPVTPRGAGTGLTGGCVPICGGILLSLEKMDRILEIDKSNSLSLVEPGVTLSKLGAELEKQELYYPVYPGEMTATIGGNAATNAGGMVLLRLCYRAARGRKGGFSMHERSSTLPYVVMPL